MTVVTVNGNTYSDDGSTAKDMNDGGSADWFFPMVQDTMIDTAGKVASTAASAAAAAASATAAIAAPNTSATSTTSVLLGVGVKNLVIQTGKSLVNGMWLTIARTSASDITWMNGSIKSYNPATGALQVTVTRAAGIITNYSDWTLTLSAPGARDSGNSVQSTSTHSVDARSDPRYQSMTPSGPSQSIDIGSNTATTPGPDLAVLHNAPSGYGHDVLVDVLGGARVGYMGPGKDMRVHGLNGGPEITGGRPYGTEMLAKLTFSSVVAGTSGIFIKSLKLDSGNELLLIHGASLHAVVVDYLGNFGTPLLIRASMSAAGEDATVAVSALHNGPDDVLIASCPANSTALQTVVLQISGTALTLGTATATTLATAAVRIVDLISVGSLSTGFVLGLMISTTSLATYGILLAGTTVTVGAILSSTTVGSWAAMLQVPATPDIFVVLTSTTTTALTAKPVTLTPGSTTQTAGTSASTTITSNSGLAVRYLDTFTIWALTLTNTTAKVVSLSLVGTTASFTAQTSVQTTITTINTIAASSVGSGSTVMQVAVSGTDSSGRFLSELSTVIVTTAPPTVNDSFAAYMAAAHVPVQLAGTRQWQLASATDIVQFNPDNVIDEWRMPGMATYAQPMAVNDPLYPKTTKARSTLRSASRAMAVLDGTKCSVVFDALGGYAEATASPVRLINSPLNYNNLSYETDVLWAASGAAPSTKITLQKLRLA